MLRFCTLFFCLFMYLWTLLWTQADTELKEQSSAPSQGTSSFSQCEMTGPGGNAQRLVCRVWRLTYLQDFALRTLVKQESLLVGGVQVLFDYFGFLFSHTHAVLQQVHLHIRCCRTKKIEIQQSEVLTRQKKKNTIRTEGTWKVSPRYLVCSWSPVWGSNLWPGWPPPRAAPLCPPRPHGHPLLERGELIDSRTKQRCSGDHQLVCTACNDQHLTAEGDREPSFLTVYSGEELSLMSSSSDDLCMKDL